jgi:hypothetical protein
MVSTRRAPILLAKPYIYARKFLKTLEHLPGSLEHALDSCVLNHTLPEWRL